MGVNTSPDESYLALQHKPNELEVIKLETKSQIVLKGGNKRKILGFHWVGDKAPHCDFFMVTSTGIEIYRVSSSSSFKLSNVRGYQFQIGHYWFESDSGILMASSSPPKLGEFNSFFMYQSKGPKYFHGPKFHLDLSPSVTDKWTSDSSNVSNLVYLEASQAREDAHKVLISQIYKGVYFIHLNCIRGKLFLYKLKHEKVKKFQTEIEVQPGDYELKVIDNMLVLLNLTLQETYIYDICSTCKTQPFAILWHGMPHKPPKMSVKIKVYIDKPYIKTQLRLLYDNTEVTSQRKSSSYVYSPEKQVLDIPLKLEKHLCYFEKDLCADLAAGKCFKIEIYPEMLTENHPNIVESILFLLRRDNYKALAFEKLRQALKQRVSLELLSFLFKNVNASYKAAALERKTSKKETVGRSDSINSPISGMTPRATSGNGFSESVIKTSSGVTVVLQSDMHQTVFQAVYEEGEVPYTYLVKAILEYIRSLMDQDIQVHQNLQILLVTILRDLRDLSLLQHLIQYHILTDSKELAMIFLELGKTGEYQPGTMLGIDMLYRLKDNGSLADSLLDSSYLYEYLALISASSYVGYDIKKLISSTEETGDELMSSVVTQFIKGNN